MTDEIIVLISLVIAFAAGSSFYKYRKAVGTQKSRFIEKAKENSHYTVGEYVDSAVHLGNYNSSDVYMRSKSLKVKYKYQVNGLTYYKHMTFQSPGKVSVDFPVNVTVYYDPKKPQKAVCPEEATQSQQLRSGCLVSIGFTVLVMFVSFHILRFLLS